MQPPSDLQSLIDTTVRVLEGFGVIGGGGYMIFKMGRMSQKFESSIELQATIAKGQAEQIMELKDEVKTIGKVVTDMALQQERITNMGARQNMLEKRLDDLAHGLGFVGIEIVRSAP